MSTPTIESVRLKGIHFRYDLEINFKPNLNVLYGENGSGKSTLIHIIANISNGDFIRFAFLDFTKIEVIYSNSFCLSIDKTEYESDKIIKISTSNSDSLEISQREAIDVIREIESERYDQDIRPELISKIQKFIETNHIPLIRTSYFPAFRTMLEAWSSRRRNSNDYYPRDFEDFQNTSLLDRATTFSRNLFGQFLPIINYPSPIDIEGRLNRQIRHCQMKIANYERSIFTDSFVEVFSALLGDVGQDEELDPYNLINDISKLTQEFTGNKLGDIQEESNTYIQLRNLIFNSGENRHLNSSATEALKVYRDALIDRKKYQERAFSAIDTYFEIVNSFLNGKELSYKLDKRRIPQVGLKFSDNTWSEIKVMSSGERQLLTMLYAVNRMSKNSIVLIDEPELSLHIDWQENLLEKMMEQLKDRQIIVCTHSPAIASDYTNNMIEVIPKFSQSSNQSLGSFDTDNIDDDGDEY